MESRPRPSARRAVVLLSGGLDSATTLALAIEQGFESYALTVRYGQRHAVEVDRAVAQAPAIGARAHRVVDLDLGFVGGSALTDPGIDVPKGRTDEQVESGIPPTYVPARNTVFLSLALAWAEGLGACDLFLIINANGSLPECSQYPIFFIAAFDTGTNGIITNIHNFRPDSLCLNKIRNSLGRGDTCKCCPLIQHKGKIDTVVVIVL